MCWAQSRIRQISEPYERAWYQLVEIRKKAVPQAHEAERREYLPPCITGSLTAGCTGFNIKRKGEGGEGGRRRGAERMTVQLIETQRTETRLSRSQGGLGSKLRNSGPRKGEA